MLDPSAGEMAHIFILTKSSKRLIVWDIHGTGGSGNLIDVGPPHHATVVIKLIHLFASISKSHRPSNGTCRGVLDWIGVSMSWLRFSLFS